MKVITIVGTIGRDCEVRENKGGEFINLFCRG